MCGIVGIVNTNEDISGDIEIVKQMNNKIKKRT